MGALLLAVVWPRKERAPRLFVLLFTAVWVGFAAAGYAGAVRNHRAAVSALASGGVEVLEGPVKDFTPAPADGATKEQFTVAGRGFALDGETSSKPGLVRNSRQGGPIRAAAVVRLHVREGRILRVEEPAPKAD